MQIDHLAAAMQMRTVGGPENGSATGGQHPCRLLRQLADHGLLNVAKAVFTFACEEIPNRATDALLYQVVRVLKRKSKTPCELSANR